MKEYLRQIFTPYGRWNRLKFWLYLLPIQILLIVPILGTIVFISLQSYTIDAKQAALYSYNQQLESMEQIAEVSWTLGTLGSDLQYQELLVQRDTIQQQISNENIDEYNATQSEDVPMFFIIYIIPLVLLISYLNIISYMKRFRDLDKSPWMTLLTFIPLVSFFVWIYCAFFKWTHGENRFWPDPLGAKKPVKNMQEL